MSTGMRLLCLFAALVVSNGQIQGRNWANSVRYEYQDYIQPRTEAEIQTLVGQATQQGRKIRVIGAGHSFSALMETSDIQVNLDLYNETINIGEDMATFQAGIRLWDLMDRLDAAGKTLPNVPYIMHQSIAGVVSTNTMATGYTGGTSTFPTELRLVVAGGDVLTVSRESQEDVFLAAAVSMGTLGIISQVTVRIEDQIKLRRYEELYTVDEVIEMLPELHAAHRQFSWVSSDAQNVSLVVWEPSDDPVEPLPDGCFTNPTSWYEQPCVDIRHRAVSHPTSMFDPVPAFPPIQIWNAEASIPLHLEQAFFREWYSLQRNELAGAIGQVFSTDSAARYTAADDLWLSPAYGTDVVVINVGANALVSGPLNEIGGAFSDLTYRFGGRFHWGKDTFYTPTQFRDVYPHFDDFNAVRAGLDPTGVFLNEFMGAVFNQPILSDQKPLE